MFQNGRECIRPAQIMAAGGDQYRVEYNILRMMRAQPVGNRTDNVGIIQHAELDRVRPNIVKHAVDLFGDKLWRNGLHRINPGCILRNDNCDSRHAVQPMRLDRFQIRLNARAARRIGAGDAENGFHIDYSSNPVPSNAGIKLSLMDSSC